MVEEWRPIEETNGDYSVSSLGRIRNNGYSFKAYNGVSVCTFYHKPRLLKGYVNKNGYLSVELHGKCRLVHRLVASAFIENVDGKPCINHKDGNKKNNAVDNLEWVTPKENNIHALSTGLRPSGGRYPHAKLTSEQVEKIRREHKPRTVGVGCKALARKYGVHHSVIQKILNGEKWRYENGSGI